MAGNIEHGDVIVEMVRQRGTMDIPALTELWNVCLKTHPPAQVSDMVRWVQRAVDNGLPIRVDSQVRVAANK